MTDKLRAAAEMALEALEDVQEAYGNTSEWFRDRVDALRQALDQLPDTTKMIDTGTDRGAWDDVPNATKWVDDLRGGDEWTPDDMAYRPGGLSVDEPPHSTKLVGEIVEAQGLIGVSIPEMPPVGTKLYTAPPKREWQGLTDEDLEDVFPAIRTYIEANKGLYRSIANAVEAKLKEKNT